MSNRKPLASISGRVQQPAVDELMYNGGMVKMSVDAGNTKIIDAGYQFRVLGPFTTDGIVQVNGRAIVE